MPVGPLIVSTIDTRKQASVKILGDALASWAQRAAYQALPASAVQTCAAALMPVV